MNLPSKELLSAVLNKEVTNIDQSCAESELKITAYFDDCRQVFTLNIYELSHKCKEWADNRGYTIVAYISGNKGWSELKYERNFKPVHSVTTASADSEPEAIFKSCQYILNIFG